MALAWLSLDLLRVAVAVPTFLYASVLDLRERRVPHRTWVPLAAVGVVALVVDATNAVALRRFAIVAGLSLGLGLLFGVGFYRLRAFGGADRVAIVVLALAFPLYPEIAVPGVGTLPVVVPNAPIFVLTVLGDAVLVGLAYPAALLVGNLRRGDRGAPWLMLLARRVPVAELHEHYGKILEAGDGDVSLRRSGLFRPHDGVTDVDFVRDYVAWSDADHLAALSRDGADGDGDGDRDGDGAADAREGDADERDDETGEEGRGSGVTVEALEAFLDDHPEWSSDDPAGDAEELAALARSDAVWISPGIPFVVPLTAGLLLALTAGDLLFLAFHALFGI